MTCLLWNHRFEFSVFFFFLLINKFPYHNYTISTPTCFIRYVVYRHWSIQGIIRFHIRAKVNLHWSSQKHILTYSLIKIVWYYCRRTNHLNLAHRIFFPSDAQYRLELVDSKSHSRRLTANKALGLQIDFPPSSQAMRTKGRLRHNWRWFGYPGHVLKTPWRDSHHRFFRNCLRLKQQKRGWFCPRLYKLLSPQADSLAVGRQHHLPSRWPRTAAVQRSKILCSKNTLYLLRRIIFNFMKGVRSDLN